MEPISIVLLFILVGFAAFFFAPLGLGGGLLFVPILHYVAGWEITPVTLLTSLILTAAVSWASGIKHRSEGLYDDELTKIALYGAIPGALIGALLVTIMENNLDFAFKVVSLGMLAYAIIRMRKRLTREEVSQDVEELQNRGMITLGSGLGGMTSAFLAVGGGAIYIPVLDRFSTASTREIVGASYGIMMWTVPIVIIAHAVLFNGEWHDLWVIFTLPICVFVMANLGAKFGFKLKDKTIISTFLVVVLVVFIRYCIDLSGYLM